MKQTQFTIENMDKVRTAMNEALKEAMSLFMKPDGGKDSWIPTIKYKTNVAVPMKVKKTGSQTNCAQVRWDDEKKAYMMSVSGEQTVMEV